MRLSAAQAQSAGALAILEYLMFRVPAGFKEGLQRKVCPLRKVAARP